MLIIKKYHTNSIKLTSSKNKKEKLTWGSPSREKIREKQKKIMSVEAAVRSREEDEEL